MKKFFTLLFFIVLNIFCISQVKAESFYIKNYDVDLKVGKDKIVNVTEKIDVYFTENRHGIVRTVPFNGYITREDNTSEKLKTKIKNIQVNKNFQTSYSSGSNGSFADIRIGDANRFVNGDVSYVIKYDYVIPKPKNLKNKDEFYFNIVGTEWDTTIDKVNFAISMPSEFDKELLGFSLGKKGTVGYDTSKLAFTVGGNQITGIISSKLYNHEGLTIRLELPNDYFVYPDDISPFAKILCTISIIFALLSYIIWNFIGKDDRVIPVVNFNPPDNLNSASVGSFFREKAENKDVVSLMIYLASKGYIKIANNDKNQFVLHKLKEYDGTNVQETTLMSALFGNNLSVSMSDLTYSKTFYIKCQDIVNQLNKNCKKLYEKNSLAFKTYIIPVLSLIISFFALIYSIFGDLSFLTDIDNLALLIFPATAFLMLPSLYKNNAILAVIFFLMFGGVPLWIFVDMTGGINMNIAAYLSLAAIIISFVCLYQMPKKSKAALKLLGNIAGFKHFLQVAEKHRIELLVKENPSYCFDILPYTYVLGVSDEFIKNFEKYMTSEYWSGIITAGTFNDFTKNCYKVTQPSVENGGIQKSSGGSRFSGGGFSGGGCGGGGGHSW